MSFRFAWFIMLFAWAADVPTSGQPDSNRQPAAADDGQAGQLADLRLRLYWPKDKLCGAVACHLVLNTAGHEVSFNEIARDLKPDMQGVSMRRLADLLQSHGLSTVAYDVAPRDLRQLMRQNRDLRVIALVKENHWVFLGDTEEAGIEYYDYPGWKLMSSSEESSLFDGPILIAGSSDRIREVRVGMRYSEFVRISSLSLLMMANIFLGYRMYLGKRSCASRLPGA